MQQPERILKIGPLDDESLEELRRRAAEFGVRFGPLEVFDPDGMGFNKYQEQAAETAIYDDRIVYPALGLANEAGELAGKVKKWMRHDYDETVLRDQAVGELGDVLWYIAAIATDLGLSLEDIAKHNIAKLNDRKARNVIQGDGDER